MVLRMDLRIIKRQIAVLDPKLYHLRLRSSHQGHPPKALKSYLFWLPVQETNRGLRCIRYLVGHNVRLVVCIHGLVGHRFIAQQAAFNLAESQN